MTLRICVVCYGDRFADLYERVAVRSLLQTRNRAAIPTDTVVAIYSDAATMGRLCDASSLLGQIERHVVTIPSDPAAHYTVQANAFADEVARCATTGDTMLMLGPDNFWGDGSLGNLLAIAGEERACFAVPHVRVDEAQFLKYLNAVPARSEVDGKTRIAISNAGLVTLAMRMLHPSWRDADLSRPIGNSPLTGIGIRQIDASTWAIRHMQPTVFLARPMGDDAAFFTANRNVPGIWDHWWPDLLAKQGRLRVIASSALVCIVELTDAASHNTSLVPVDPTEPMAFRRNAAHIALNRAVVSIWRSA